MVGYFVTENYTMSLKIAKSMPKTAKMWKKSSKNGLQDKKHKLWGLGEWRRQRETKDQIKDPG